MSRIFQILSFVMAAAMSLFSPVTASHGQGQCCAECVLKREDEVELVYEDEDSKEKEE